MAYSPSPGPPANVTVAGLSAQYRRRSATPPNHQQPLSKRDKRRNAIDQRLRDLESNFRGNREVHSRAQLNALSRDINYIYRANPYDAKLLEDSADDLGTSVPNSTGDNVHSGLRGGGPGVLPMDSDNRVPLGKWASMFVEEINNAMEERDTALTELESRYPQRLRELQEECEFSIRVAIEEHKLLKHTVRERAITNIRHRKKQIQKDKDFLDAADTNALLFYPSQFTITQSVSPGGMQSNRKTRHTRHRLDLDNFETTGESHKRKRKAPADFDNGSPPAGSRAPLEPEAAFYWDKGHGLLEQPQIASLVLSVDRLFSTRELAMHLKSAIEVTAHHWATKRSKPHESGKGMNGGPHIPNGDLSDTDGIGTHTAAQSDGEAEQEDHSMLAATVMERTGSHVTRSTRLTRDDGNLLNEAFNGKPEDAARCFGAASVKAHLLLLRQKDDVPVTAPLSTQDATDDLELFEQAIADGKY